MNYTQHGNVAVGAPRSLARTKSNLDHLKELYAAAREGGESELVLATLSEQIGKLRADVRIFEAQISAASRQINAVR